ncbi:MAG: DUF1501 domain-containing protein [Candidatus Eremiobacteraeota bacterium]|nr:DUF1501 domain-containing protein [Candidatus Eremiobacteraeota bacterium]
MRFEVKPLSRSSFLLGAVSGLAVVGKADSIFAQALAQTPLPGLPGSSDRVLVVINFQGGNDGLNTVVPYGNPDYYRFRPSLGVAANDVLRIDDVVGFNPVLAPFKKMYDAGQVAVVQGVGYPDPDHSHFRSTEIWQTAQPKGYESTGWLGRYLDQSGLPASNLFNAVALANVLPEALIARKTDVPAIDAVRTYGLRSDRNTADREAFHEFVRDTTVPFRSPFLAQVAEIEDHAQRGAEELPKLISGYQSQATYPQTPLGRSLALAAQIVGSRLGTRVLFLQHGSFDTHVTQKQTQDRLLGDFANAISAFYTDLAAHGSDKRVLTMTFSEFGRRVGENGSRGTDHGEAAPLFLVGGGVKGGLYGAHPDLARLNMGNLAYTTDFRSVYATVLERWLGRPSQAIVGGAFPTLPALA